MFIPFTPHTVKLIKPVEQEIMNKFLVIAMDIKIVGFSKEMKEKDITPAVQNVAELDTSEDAEDIEKEGKDNEDEEETIIWMLIVSKDTGKYYFVLSTDVRADFN